MTQRSSRIERRYVPCPCCGTRWMEATQYICSKCEERTEDRWAGKVNCVGRDHARTLYANAPETDNYKLLWSPEECWQRLSLWVPDHLRETLKMGYMTEGTVFERGGRRYVVVGDKPQRLEAE